MIRIFGIAAVLLAIHVIAEPAARAQRSPDMATLDRGDGISKLGIDVGLTFLEFPPYEKALRAELYGQYVTRSGLGLYGALPLARSFGAADDNQDPVPPDLLPNNATAIGNLELGGLFVATMSPRFSWVFRGGVALPIGTSGRDSSATLLSATYPRLTDIALASDAWYVRFGVSPLLYFDKVFFRADLGFDLGIDDNDVTENDMFRLNVGAGVDFGIVALSLELVNLATLDDFGNGERFVHSLALTTRFMGESLQPFLTVGAPLDQSRRDLASLFVAGGIVIVP